MLFFGLWGATERRTLGMLSPEQDREIKKVQCQQRTERQGEGEGGREDGQEGNAVA